MEFYACIIPPPTMKALFVTLAICLAACHKIQAQTPAPIITELREIVADAGTGFRSYRGDVIEHDSSSGVIYYKSTHIPQASTAAHYLIENAKTGSRFYRIRYDVKAMDGMQLRIMKAMAQKYIEEINAMLNSGAFDGRDYKNEDGADVTELKDKRGENIIDYQSDADQQVIIVYGTGRA